MHKTTINTKFYCIFKCCIGSWHGRNSKMTIFQNINTWKPCFMIYHYHYSCPTKRSLYWRKQAQIFFGWGCGVKLHFKCFWSSGRSILVHQWPPCKYNSFHDKCIQSGSKVILIPSVLCISLHAYIFFAKILNLVPSQTKRLMLHTTLMRLHSFEKTPLWHTYCYLKTKAKGNNILGVITCLRSLEFVQSHVRILHCNIW